MLIQVPGAYPQRLSRGGGASGGWEQGSKRGKTVCGERTFSSRPTVFPSFILQAFLGSFIRGRYPATPLGCFISLNLHRNPKKQVYRLCHSSKSIYRAPTVSMACSRSQIRGSEQKRQKSPPSLGLIFQWERQTRKKFVRWGEVLGR